MGFSSPQLAQMSLISQGAGAASSIAGSYFGAKSQASNLAFKSNMDGINAGIVGSINSANSTIADTNAHVAEQAAQTSLLQGQQQVGISTLKAAQIKSGQRAAMAANGIDLGEGNAAETQASTDIIKEIDANTIQANAVRSAWGYRTQGQNIKNTAASAAMQSQISQTNLSNDALLSRASADSISPFSSAASSFLTGAGSVASSWYTMNKTGAK